MATLRDKLRRAISLEQFIDMNGSPFADGIKQTRNKVQRKIDDSAEALNKLSQEIWSNPELAYQETHAHKVLTDFLEEEGFEVTREYHLKTAFKATFGGKAGIHVCVICEYDALPEVGHASGHNLIAECGVAVGLGVKTVLEEPESPSVGRVTILGTPAKESGGGKIDLIKAGAFEGVDIALMAHPFQSNMPKPICLASESMNVHFTGRAAHAASGPWMGLNALDAAVMFYNSVSVMRQQFKPDWRVHGTFIKAGDVSSSIPEESELQLYLQTVDKEDAPKLKEKITQCAKGAAISTGCQVKCECDGENSYSSLLTNNTLASLYERLAASLDVSCVPGEVTFSTDMGDVSRVVPSILVLYNIGTKAPSRSKAFLEAAGAPEAQAPTLQQAKALAITALDLMQPNGNTIVERIKREFNDHVGEKKKIDKIQE
ncbi:xaa-Arg dipeptidase-like [Diadema setosum]|uniref:xaa-Arg dipeptidase-like n=1 Tax=Diadema setosum TaxID=31175 RepID=UPI003B3B2C8E